MKINLHPFASAAAFCLLTGVAPAVAGTLSVTIISEMEVGAAISDSNVVAGTTYPNGLVWYNGDSMVLPVTGAVSTTALACNGTTVAGTYTTPGRKGTNGEEGVFSYDAVTGETRTYLVDPREEVTSMAINGSDEVVLTTDPWKNAGFSVASGTVTTIKPPMAKQISASGINDNGVIVGTEVTSKGIFGYKLNNGTYQKYAVPDATATSLTAISNGGATIGRYKDSSGVWHAFLAILGLPVANIDYPGAAPGSTFPVAISLTNEVVGYWNDATGASHGFLLFNGVRNSFDVHGASNTVINGVNLDGSIVGTEVTRGVSNAFVGICALGDNPCLQ